MNNEKNDHKSHRSGFWQRKHRRSLASLLLTAGLLASVTACSKTLAQPSEAPPSPAPSAAKSGENTPAKSAITPVKLTACLDWTPNTNHTGLYVAKEKGYFKDEGLDVDFQQPPEDGAAALVASGKAQLGIDFQDMLAAAFSQPDPLPVTAVAAIINHNTSGIISLKSKGITSPKELEGKTYATWDSPIEQAMLKDVMKSDGGDFSKVKLVPAVTDVIAALQTNVDAVWVYYGWDGVAAQQKKLDTNYWAFKDINPVFDYYSPVIIANNTFLKEHPEQAKAFLKAAEKGYRYAVEHPDEAAEILHKATPETDMGLLKASQEWVSKQYLADGSRWGYMAPERWNAFYKWLSDNKLLAKDISQNVGFSDDYLP